MALGNSCVGTPVTDFWRAVFNGNTHQKSNLLLGSCQKAKQLFQLLTASTLGHARQKLLEVLNVSGFLRHRDDAAF